MRKRKINKTINFLFVVLLSLSSCKEKEGNTKEFIFEQIESSVNKTLEEGKVLDVNSLLSFKWEKLHIFKPYSTNEVINTELGFKWELLDRINLNQDDSYNLLVFSSGSEVVKYIRWPRASGDFSKIEKTMYRPNDAQFISEKEKVGNEDWYFFYHK